MSQDSSATAKKIATGMQKKVVADRAFVSGQLKDALKSYHESLMYLAGIDNNALKNMGMIPSSDNQSADPIKEKSEIDEIIEKIYANMSACHLKLENWKRAVETADKALAKNENNFKAMFRKAKALGEQGYFERAHKILEDLKKRNLADGATVDAEISRFRAIENERDKAYKQKLKGFLSRDRGEKKTTETTS